jgi:YgiT-type zinc finger domain-containing protein
MKCPLCNSELKDNQFVTVKRIINGKPVYFQNVPAQICSNQLCGEEILHGTIVKKMRSIINKAKEENYDFDRTFDFNNGDHFIRNTLEHVK